MASEEYALVHAILGKALRASPPEIRGAPPYGHAVAGPVPKLSANDQARVVLFCAEYVRAHVDGKNLARFDEILGLARRRLGGEEGFEELWKAASEPRSRTGGLVIAQLVASALYARPDNVFMVAGAAAKRVVDLLDPADIASFLAALDHCILRVECQAAVSRYAGEAAPAVERVLWRADRGNGRAGHFICTLADSDDTGLITKMKNRWRWFRGPADDMLATLPDDLFEAGATAIARR